MYFQKGSMGHSFFKKGGQGAYFLKSVANALENPHVASVLSTVSPQVGNLINNAKAGGYLEKLKHY